MSRELINPLYVGLAMIVGLFLLTTQIGNEFLAVLALCALLVAGLSIVYTIYLLFAMWAVRINKLQWLVASDIKLVRGKR